MVTDNKTGMFGHQVNQGAVYLEGFYVEKLNETKHKVMYKKLHKRVCIHQETIFCPNVAFNKTYVPRQGNLY